MNIASDRWAQSYFKGKSDPNFFNDQPLRTLTTMRGLDIPGVATYRGLAATKFTSAKLTKNYTVYKATLHIVFKQSLNWVCTNPFSCILSYNVVKLFANFPYCLPIITTKNFTASEKLKVL